MPRGRRVSLPEHVKGVPYWRCSSCEDYRPAKRFCACAAKSNGLSSWCRDCQSDRSEASYTRRRIIKLRAELERLEGRG
ncbi:MAG: hypothetical protein V3W44_10885 [Dehalococcoidales bacterium]